MKKIVITVAALVLSFNVMSEDFIDKEGNAPQRPSVEAFEVCADKADGTSVTVASELGVTLKAVCKPYLYDQLAAQPINGKRIWDDNSDHEYSEGGDDYND